MLPVVILAGGLSTRMRNYSREIPKSLFEVNGEPFISLQLKELSRQGIKKVIICIGHLGDQIQSVVGNGSSYGLDISYSVESKILLGTGGAIRKALHLLDKNFFVLYGDSWLQVNYYKVWRAFIKSRSPALMVIYHNKGLWDTSNVEMDGNFIKLYSKTKINKRMTHIDYGLGILNIELIKKYPQEVIFDLSKIYEGLSKKGLLANFEVKKRFYEIGSPDGFYEINNFFQKKTNVK